MYKETWIASVRRLASALKSSNLSVKFRQNILISGPGARTLVIHQLKSSRSATSATAKCRHVTMPGRDRLHSIAQPRTDLVCEHQLTGYICIVNLTHWFLDLHRWMIPMTLMTKGSL